MFTGIIEATGTIASITQEGSNRRFTIESSISSELKVDQSLSHNGVCLTIVAASGNRHEVVAVQETLDRSNLGNLKEGDQLNLERAMLPDGRFDGHIIQGHVDDVATVADIKTKDGSWVFEFHFDKKHAKLLVEKGSVTVNGVSLTVIKPKKKSFSVAIIPHTFNHTSFGMLKAGDQVNLEFDIIGKYVMRILKKSE